MDFSTLKGLTIPEGVVTQIADASGRVLWSAAATKAKVTLYFSTSVVSGNSDVEVPNCIGMAYVDIEGVRYTDDGNDTEQKIVEVEVPFGTVITLTATGGTLYTYSSIGGHYNVEGYSGGGICVNREWIYSDGIDNSTKVYNRTINEDTQIFIDNYYESYSDMYDADTRYGSIKLKNKA